MQPLECVVECPTVEREGEETHWNEFLFTHAALHHYEGSIAVHQSQSNRSLLYCFFRQQFIQPIHQTPQHYRLYLRCYNLIAQTKLCVFIDEFYLSPKEEPLATDPNYVMTTLLGGHKMELETHLLEESKNIFFEVQILVNNYIVLNATSKTYLFEPEKSGE